MSKRVDENHGGTMKPDKADLFAGYWRMLVNDTPRPMREYNFCEGRKFRFDFAWGYPRFVAVEIDGGNRMAKIVNGKAVAVGRHTQETDYFKLNLAASMGWRVLRFTPAMLERDPQACIDVVMRALEYEPWQITVL